MLRWFNDISIRGKLIAIIAGAVAILTTAVLVSVWLSAWREVRTDVHDELLKARQEFELTETENLHEHALEAQAIAGDDDLLRFLEKRDAKGACAWLADLLNEKNAPLKPEDSFDLVALLLPSGHPVGLVLRGKPPCEAKEMGWHVPALQKQDNAPEITNWESGDGRLYELIASPVVDEKDLRQGVIVLGFEISDVFSRHIKEHTGQDNIVWHREGDKFHLLGATIPSLRNLLTPAVENGGINGEVETGGYDVLDAAIEDHEDVLSNPNQLHIALVQSLDEKFRPFRNLEYVLLSMALLALLLGWIVGVFLSRPIAIPLISLASAAESVSDGQLDVADEVLRRHPERLVARDEIGVLGRSFVRMVQGLKERLAMSTFVSEATVDHIRRNVSSDSGGERTSLCILFCDVRQFSTFAETRDPEAVIQLLNEVLSIEAETVSKHGGDIDKFVGDALIGWFSGKDRCLRAVSAVHEMMTALRERFHGQPGTTIGAGIHVGEVVVGSVGSRARKDYTAIGSTVNLAARLCSHAAPWQILVSHAVAAELGPETELKPLAPITLKGFSEPVPVFDVAVVKAAET